MLLEPTPASAVHTPERILQRIDWQVIRRLDGLLQGDYRTLFFGTGIDFTDLREYQPEDDIRHIDWNVTARMNSPYIRQYVEDREITAWFMVDLSPSMGFGLQERSKKLVLVDFVASLARILTRGGNRTGAILYNNELYKTIPPRGGRIQVLRLIHELLDESEPPPGKMTDLSELLQAGLNTFKRRSLVILISDFFSTEGWERPLRMLRQRHECIALRLWDQREVELPEAGLIYMEDSETGEQIYVDTSSLDFRRRFRELSIQRESALQEKIQQAGVDLFDISTEEDLVKALIRIADLRKKRRR